MDSILRPEGNSRICVDRATRFSRRRRISLDDRVRVFSKTIYFEAVSVRARSTGHGKSRDRCRGPGGHDDDANSAENNYFCYFEPGESRGVRGQVPRADGHGSVIQPEKVCFYSSSTACRKHRRFSRGRKKICLSRASQHFPVHVNIFSASIPLSV